MELWQVHRCRSSLDTPGSNLALALNSLVSPQIICCICMLVTVQSTGTIQTVERRHGSPFFIVVHHVHALFVQYSTRLEPSLVSLWPRCFVTNCGFLLVSGIAQLSLRLSAHHPQEECFCLATFTNVSSQGNWSTNRVIRFNENILDFLSFPVHEPGPPPPLSALSQKIEWPRQSSSWHDSDHVKLIPKTELKTQNASGF